MRLFDVTLQSATGRTVIVTVGAKTGTVAAGIAIKAQDALCATDEGWRALHCTSRG